MLMAELNIAAEDFPEAKRALGDLVTSDPTARSLTIMAAISRGEGDADAVVRGWLAKALAAPRGPQWVCDNCQQVHGGWEPVCTNCKSFDTLSWRSPPETEAGANPGVEILPLIVGAIEDKTDAPDEDSVEPDHEVIVVEASDADLASDVPEKEVKA